VDFAFIEDRVNGGIRLKMHSYQVCQSLLVPLVVHSSRKEAAVFAERRAAMETWELLTQLDRRIELRWIMNGTESRAFVHIYMIARTRLIDPAVPVRTTRQSLLLGSETSRFGAER
jgi:hypothetical protein